MKITFSINNNDLSPENKNHVYASIGIDNDSDLLNALNKLGKAALIEYLNMLAEGGMPGRADELKQNRLYFLIKFYFQNRLPSESEISSIFQLTASSSKTLLKNTTSRFRTKLENESKNSMKAVIEKAEFNEQINRYYVIIESGTIKDDLNMLIAQKEPTFSQITKRKDSASQYEISEDSYELLKSELGIKDANE